MKFLCAIIILFLCLSFESNAQGDTLVINLKNNRVEKILISQIQKIQFENVTAVEEQSKLSNSLAVAGNYPNPFAEQTNIEFEIGSSGNVEVII